MDAGARMFSVVADFVSEKVVVLGNPCADRRLASVLDRLGIGWEESEVVGSVSDVFPVEVVEANEVVSGLTDDTKSGTLDLVVLS